ncbi:unnamed protein product [Amoebophrya sp. A120]|nr:unnamed protein product [Amoebophrya sp. A120]|eukprot:GSA120T00002287001.1
MHQEKQEALAEAKALVIGDHVQEVDDDWTPDVDAFFEKFPDIAGHDRPTTTALVDRVCQELMVRTGEPAGDVPERIYQKCSEALRRNKGFLAHLFTHASKENGSELYTVLSEEQNDDDDLVTLAVRMHEAAFLNASQRLQHKPSIVLEALDSGHQSRPHEGGDVLDRLSEGLRSDKFFARDVMRHSEHLMPRDRAPGTFLDYFDPALRADEDVVASYLSNSAFVDRVASPLMESRDFVMDHLLAPMCRDVHLVESFFSCVACARYRSDRELMRELIRANGTNFRFASPELREDTELQLLALASEAVMCAGSHSSRSSGVEEAEGALTEAVANKIERLYLEQNRAAYLSKVYMRCPMMAARLAGWRYASRQGLVTVMAIHRKKVLARECFGLVAAGASSRGVDGICLDGYLWTFTRLGSSSRGATPSTNPFEVLGVYSPSAPLLVSSMPPNADPKIIAMRQRAIDAARGQLAPASETGNPGGGQTGSSAKVVLPRNQYDLRQGNPRLYRIEVLAREGLSGLASPSLTQFCVTPGRLSHYEEEQLAGLCKDAGHLLVVNDRGIHHPWKRPRSPATRLASIADRISDWGRCPYALPVSLRDDEEFVCDLLRAGWFGAFFFASEEVRNRDCVVRLAVEEYGFEALWYVSEAHAQQKPTIMAAARASCATAPGGFVDEECWLLTNLSELMNRDDLRADPEFLSLMAKTVPVQLLWRKFPKNFRSNAALALKFLQECARAGGSGAVLDMWRNLGPSQRADPAFLAAVESNLLPNTGLSQLPRKFLDCLLPEQRATALSIVAASTTGRDCRFYSFWRLPLSSQKSKDFYLAAVRQLLRCGDSLGKKRSGLRERSRVPWVLRDDIHFIRAIAELNSDSAVALASSRVLADKDFVLETIKRVRIVENEDDAEKQSVCSDKEKDVAANTSAVEPPPSDVRPHHPRGMIPSLLAATSRANCRDENVIREAVMRNGDAISEASWELRNSLEIGLLAVKQNGLALRYLSCELAKDEQICLAAVQSNGLALEYCSMEVRSSSLPVAHAAVKQNAKAWRFLRGEELLSDPDLFRVACAGHPDFFWFSVGFMERDPDFFASMFIGEGGNVELLNACGFSDPLINDKDAMRKILREDGEALKYTPLRSDAASAMLAVRSNGAALRHVAPSLLGGSNGRALVLAALRSKNNTSLKLLHAVPPRLLASDAEVQAALARAKVGIDKHHQAMLELYGLADDMGDKARRVNFTAEDFADLAATVSSSTHDDSAMVL